VQFAMPQLIWNMMVSMSGGWFFVVASEAISVGNTTITLPGVGSYIALAIERRDLAAVCYAIVTMLIVILIYDQVLFRPLITWADRFRFEQEPGIVPPESWVLDVMRRSRLVDRLTEPFASSWRRLLVAGWWKEAVPVKRQARWLEEAQQILWKQGASTVINLQIRDAKFDHSNAAAATSTGVFFHDGRRKPAFRAWRFPFVVTDRSRGSARVWLRPPESGRLRVQSKRHGHWHTVRASKARARRIATFRVHVRSGRPLRAAVGKSRSLPWGG
jgi:hypothetical protein